MAFADKIDYVGLGLEAPSLKLRSNAQNATNSVLEVPGADGSIICDEIYGHIKAPTCGYAVVGETNLSSINLGQVYSQVGPYALSRVHISTGAGQEPTVDADAVQIEQDATRSICTYQCSTTTVTPARHALTFGAFTFTESCSLALQTCEYEASVNLTPATINGDPVASDSTLGRETVTITMWSRSETDAPAVTISQDWHVTSDWTCTGADSSMFVWTCTLSHYLTASEA